MAKRGKCMRKKMTAKGPRCVKYAGSKPPRKPCKTAVRVGPYSRRAGVKTHKRSCPKR
jgi:hypothetical protein